MWKLTIEDDEGTKTLLPLVRDEYHVGRDEKNSIRLTERNISRHHATLKKNGGAAWHVLDHDSYNGCYVNGQRVAGDLKLSHSDIIQLGDYRIFITNEAITETDPSQGMGGAATSPAINIAADKPDRLVMLSGPDIGAEHSMNHPSVTIGRAEDCTISVNHPSVSRVHCEIKPLGAGRYEIFDRGSANGVRVNGIDFRRTLLEGGDLLELGDVKMRFVERGQIYRPHADMTQQLSALTAGVPTAARPGALPRASGKTGILIGAAAAGMVVLVVLVVYSLSGSANEPVAAAPDDASGVVLDAARKAYNSGDFPGAVAKLSSLPEGSPGQRTPEAERIYGRWAEQALEKAAAASDPSEKKAILGPVAENTHVPAEKRKLAEAELARLASAPADARPAASVAPLETNPSKLPDAPPDPPSRPTNGTAGGSDPPQKTPVVPRKDPSDKPPPPTIDPTAGQDAEMKTRKQLEGRLNSGKATKDDLRMLKAICQHQSDAACKARAIDGLQKLNK
jgi:ABC transport system ATP-binding/permease protein